MIESGYTRSVSRDVLAHAGVPHHEVHACHARRVAWFLRRRSQLCRWEPSFPKAIFTRTSGPAITCLLHVLPGCTTSGDIGAGTLLWPPAPSWPLRRRGAVLAPLSVRYLRVNRSPGVDEEGRGDGLRRCGGRGNVLRRDRYEQRFYHL